MENDDEERKFLHDLASPAASVSLILDTLVDELKEKPGMDPDFVRMMNQALLSTQKITALLTSRRDLLIQRSVIDDGPTE